jgi:hypothetical protein
MYCLCVNVYCHRVSTQLQLANISISIYWCSVHTSDDICTYVRIYTGALSAQVIIITHVLVFSLHRQFFYQILRTRMLLALILSLAFTHVATERDSLIHCIVLFAYSCCYKWIIRQLLGLHVFSTSKQNPGLRILMLIDIYGN